MNMFSIQTLKQTSLFSLYSYLYINQYLRLVYIGLKMMSAIIDSWSY